MSVVSVSITAAATIVCIVVPAWLMRSAIWGYWMQLQMAKLVEHVYRDVIRSHNNNPKRCCSAVCEKLFPLLKSRFKHWHFLLVHGLVDGHDGEHDWLAFSERPLSDEPDEGEIERWLQSAHHLDPTYNQFIEEAWSFKRARDHSILPYQPDFRLTSWYRKLKHLQ